MNNFSFNVQIDGLAFLTLSRQPVNALSRKFIASLSVLIDEISKDPKIKVLIISSSIEHFCAGADLKERANLTINETEVAVSGIGDCFSKLENLPYPTISAINGSVLGGGLELSLCISLIATIRKEFSDEDSGGVLKLYISELYSPYKTL